MCCALWRISSTLRARWFDRPSLRAKTTLSLRRGEPGGEQSLLPRRAREELRKASSSRPLRARDRDFIASQSSPFASYCSCVVSVGI